MTKFVLHGGFSRRENDSNYKFYKEVVSDIDDGGTVLLVYFASREEDTSYVFSEQVQKFKSVASDKNLHFINASQENFLSEVKQADVIYIHGGSTNKLLTILRNYPDLRPLIEGKTVAGSSAGAYAIAKYGASHSEKEMRAGLDLAPLRVICHYESLELPPYTPSIENLKNTAQDLELVILKDYEWEVFRF